MIFNENDILNLNKNAPEPEKPVRRRLKLKFKIIFFAIIFGAVLGSCTYAYYYKIPEKFWEKLIPVPENGDRVIVLIEAGINARQAAREFERQGALEDGENYAKLVYWLTRLNVDRKIRPGHYNVIKSSPWILARQLRDTKPALIKMTIIPGADIFSLSDDLLSFDLEIITASVMNDFNYPVQMRSKLPDTEEGRIAFLRPETYLVVDKTPADLVRAASFSWWEKFGASSDLLPSGGLIEASIVASMVEREVLRDSECSRVSGVIYNRLERNMALQIDATVVYAWKLKGRKLTRVLNKDLEIDSPYNTYKVSGLPPGPICIPGDAAWEAALEPELNEYYYYVAGKSGYHYFSTNYSEHLRNVRKARSER